MSADAWGRSLVGLIFISWIRSRVCFLSLVWVFVAMSMREFYLDLHVVSSLFVSLFVECIGCLPFVLLFIGWFAMLLGFFFRLELRVHDFGSICGLASMLRPCFAFMRGVFSFSS